MWRRPSGGSWCRSSRIAGGKEEELAKKNADTAPGAKEEPAAVETPAKSDSAENLADAPDREDETPAGEAPPETPEEAVARLEAELAEARDRSLRTLAEFDNFRKRTERDRIAIRERAVAEVLCELLDISDNLERALDQPKEGVPAAFLEGMELIARGVRDILDRRGVERIVTGGAPFDPRVHEALAQQPSSDCEPNTVLSEVQPGYRAGERVLRPAKVIVARASTEADAPTDGAADAAADE